MEEFEHPVELPLPSGDNIIFGEGVISKNIVSEDDENRVIDIHIAPFFHFSEEKDGVYDLPIDPRMVGDHQFKRYNQLTYSIGKIIRLAEMNYDELGHFLKMYFNRNDFKEVRARLPKKCKQHLMFEEPKPEFETQPELEKKPKFEDLTFGKQRNIFSCILKMDTIFHTIPELNTPEKRNYATDLYNKYIIDRDCYTHGKIFFHGNDLEPVLRVKKPGQEESYVKISHQILWDNLKIYLLLTNYIKRVREALETI